MHAVGVHVRLHLHAWCMWCMWCAMFHNAHDYVAHARDYVALHLRTSVYVLW